MSKANEPWSIYRTFSMSPWNYRYEIWAYFKQVLIYSLVFLIWKLFHKLNFKVGSLIMSWKILIWFYFSTIHQVSPSRDNIAIVDFTSWFQL